MKQLLGIFLLSLRSISFCLIFKSFVHEYQYVSGMYGGSTRHIYPED